MDLKLKSFGLLQDLLGVKFNQSFTSLKKNFLKNYLRTDGRSFFIFVMNDDVTYFTLYYRGSKCFISQNVIKHPIQCWFRFNSVHINAIQYNKTQKIVSRQSWIELKYRSSPGLPCRDRKQTMLNCSIPLWSANTTLAIRPSSPLSGDRREARDELGLEGLSGTIDWFL